MQEVVMSNVTVFRYEDSAELYSVPSIYISREIGKFKIEAVPSDLLGDEDDRKKPLNEGNVRGLIKGQNVGQQNKPATKPIAPPPPPKPQSERK